MSVWFQFIPKITRQDQMWIFPRQVHCLQEENMVFFSAIRICFMTGAIENINVVHNGSLRVFVFIVGVWR